MQVTDAIRVWDMQDLNILDGLENAICVNIYGLYGNDHRYAFCLHLRSHVKHQCSAQYHAWAAVLMECKRPVE